jgi:NADPH2:quinone reductase
MRAVQLSEFGPPQVLAPVEMRDPVAGAGQAIVAVAFASITFVETQVRAGHPPHPAMIPALPVVLGNGVGGVVISVGEGVSPALVGARVVTSTGGSGGYAERVAVPGAGLIPVPDELRLDDAAALLADGRTAVMLTRAAAVRPGDVVLVEAAAGGVGSLLVQVARHADARVVAAAGTQPKLALARELGADFAVNYRESDWADRVRAEVNAVDVVFDGVGGAIGRTAFTLLSPAGRFSPYGMASGSFANISQVDADQHGVALIRSGPPTPEQTLELARFALGEAAAGRLRPVIGQRFPLERAADAHTAIESRATLGKTLLVVGANAESERPRISDA